MNKLGPPKTGFYEIRPLTRREREITGLSSDWCIGRDSGGILRFYEKEGTGYSYGYGPKNEGERLAALQTFWDED